MLPFIVSSSPRNDGVGEPDRHRVGRHVGVGSNKLAQRRDASRRPTIERESHRALVRILFVPKSTERVGIAAVNVSERKKNKDLGNVTPLRQRPTLQYSLVKLQVYRIVSIVRNHHVQIELNTFGGSLWQQHMVWPATTTESERLQILGRSWRLCRANPTEGSFVRGRYG